jgi:hypothetical protein
MLKVISFDNSKIVTEFAGQDLYRLKQRVELRVKTTEGVLHYTMFPGFLTNMRSGSHAIDVIIPKFTENNRYNLALLCHDFNYTRLTNGDHPVSRELADALLKQMVLMSRELGSFKAALMYRVVRLFGGSAYESQNADDYNGLYKDVANYMGFKWDARR